VVFALDRNDFEKVLPLYKREGTIFPLILAVIQQKQRGWIFVDDLSHIASALVVTNAGFMQFVGADAFFAGVMEFFGSPNTNLPTYLLWYSPSSQIQKILDKFVPEHIRRRERTRFVFNKQNNIEDPVECPRGFKVQFIDKELIKKIEHFKLNIAPRFWVSEDDFLEHGIGACVMKDGEVVSLCYSACVVDNLAEIDVVTREEYRGRGLAVIASQNFILKCMQRGIMPTWDCFVNNTPSMKLACRLGFTQTLSYPFYSFNLPVNLIG
jgi:RimJ/RimL family protein N-acetyltransferase